MTAVGRAVITAQVVADGVHHTVRGEGSGPISAFVRGLRREFDVQFDVVDYAEHAIDGRRRPQRRGHGGGYVETVGRQDPDGTDEARWGIGIDVDITTAGLKAVLGALERQQR